MRNDYVKLVEQARNKKVIDQILSEDLQGGGILDESIVTDIEKNPDKMKELIDRFRKGNESVDGFDLSGEAIMSVVQQTGDLRKIVIAVKMIAASVLKVTAGDESGKSDISKAIVAVKIGLAIVKKILLKTEASEELLGQLDSINDKQIERVGALALKDAA